jgi:hypothetical protein
MSEKYRLGAIDTETNVYTSPFYALKGRAYKCLDCHKKVILRKGLIRVAHFAHYAQTSTCSYYEHPNESQLHKEAKHKLSDWLKKQRPITIFWCCNKCTGFPAAPEVHVKYEEGDTVVVEYRDPKNKYVADVAVVNNDRLKYIFEVKHTHATLTDSRPEPWYEFSTDDIFEMDTENPTETDAVVFQCVKQNIKRYCNTCIALEEKWVLNLPRLDKKIGAEKSWQQDKPCLKCGREKYNPIFVKGYRQICKICVGEYKDELEAKYAKQEMKIYTECIISD